MWPVLYGLSGMVPLGCIGAWACAGSGVIREPADAPTAPIVTPSRFRKSRRLTSSVIGPPSVGGSVRYRVTAPVDTVGYRAGPAKSSRAEIGRASCRERV